MGVTVHNFMQLDGCPDAILGWTQRRNDIRFCANLRKCVMKTLAMIRQVLGNTARAVHGKSKLTVTEKGKTGEEHAYHCL
jgi:hypothetical protein